MNDKHRPTPTAGSTDAVMPKDIAEVAETGKDVDTGDGKKAGGEWQKMKEEVEEATDLPQKGSA